MNHILKIFFQQPAFCWKSEIKHFPWNFLNFLWQYFASFFWLILLGLPYYDFYISSLEVCLSEVIKSDILIGIIGSRYGWCPSTYDLKEETELKDWLSRQEKGLSITDLEIRAFLEINKNRKKALFFKRNPLFLRYEKYWIESWKSFWDWEKFCLNQQETVYLVAVANGINSQQPISVKTKTILP